MPLQNNRNRISILFLLLAVFLTGCPKVTKVVSPPIAPPEPLLLEKTFGEITYGGLATLLIRYKDIVLLTDPVFEPIGLLGTTKARLDTLHTPGQIRRTAAPFLSVNSIPHVDYLLLTDGQPHHFGDLAKSSLRKDLKIIATDETVQALKSHGFTQSKGLGHVSRLMLKKGDNFLFVSVIQSRNPASAELVNGYLLEFDNGRNIFISGEIVDEAVLRDFVYGLRDDGKQLDLAFVYAGSLKTISDKVWQSANEDLCASFIGLLQPKVGIILQSSGLDVATFDELRYRAQLQEQIYSGETIIPKPSEVFPF